MFQSSTSKTPIVVYVVLNLIVIALVSVPLVLAAPKMLQTIQEMDQELADLADYPHRLVIEVDRDDLRSRTIARLAYALEREIVGPDVPDSPLIRQIVYDKDRRWARVTFYDTDARDRFEVGVRAFGAIAPRVGLEVADVEPGPDDLVVRLTDKAVLQMDDDLSFVVPETIRKRLFLAGIEKTDIEAEEWPGRIHLGFETEEALDLASKLFVNQGDFEFYLVSADAPRVVGEMLPERGAVPRGVKYLKTISPLEPVLALKARPFLSGDHVLSAGHEIDLIAGTPSITINIDKEGAAVMREMTGTHVGERLAIVVDQRVISAPYIREPVSGSMVLNGNFTAEEAAEIANNLRAGALPARFDIVSMGPFGG